MDKKYIEKSTQLSYLLRHSAEPNSEGWMDVDSLSHKYGFLPDDVEYLVANDAKGRFEFSSDHSAVRALYGHSNHVELMRPSAVPPVILYHGTSVQAAKTIEKEGIKSRARNWVHLSTTIEQAVETGLRHGQPYVFAIDTLAMLADGFIFQQASASVWLVREVPTKYFLKDSEDE